MQRKLNDEFIREYSEEFSEKITTEFFADNERISGKEILNVSPSKQVNFFILKILFRKWQEEMKRLESPFFNYKNPDVRKAMVQFMNTLSQHIEVSKEHFGSMVEEAVADTLLLAMEPGSYLSLEFEEMDVSKITDKLTKPILKYIKLHRTDIEEFFTSSDGLEVEEFVDAAGEYFYDIETDSLVQQQVDLLSQVVPLTFDDLYFSEDELVDEFEEEEDDEDVLPFDDSVLTDDEDDSEVSFDYPEDDDEPELVEDNKAEAVSEIEEATQDESEVIEDEEIEHEDSEVSHLAEEDSESFDEESYDEDADEEIEEEDSELEDQDTEEDDLDSEIEAESDQDFSEQEADEPSKELASDEFEGEQLTEESPLVESSESEEGEEDEADSSINQKYAERKPTINDRFIAEEKETVANKLETKQVNNIMEAISVNHRYMFTKELFEGDREAFVDAIDQLDAKETFDDAVETLVQQYANKLQWDMNSDEVKELLKVIFRRFR